MNIRDILGPVRPQSGRTWLWLVMLLFVALFVFMPLRLALGLTGLAESGLSARTAGGTIWNGRIADGRLGSLGIGTMDAGLDPLPLLLGRLRFDVERIGGAPLSGAVEVGVARRAVHGLTGIVTGGVLGGMPVEQLSLEAITIVFVSGRCTEASGRVRMVLRLADGGPATRTSLSGVARCADGDLQLPLTGDSGVERLNLRISGDGRYVGTFGTASQSGTIRIAGQL